MKFGTLTNSNIVNSMVVFTFSVLQQRYPFPGKLVHKRKVPVLAEIWYQDQLDCLEFDGDVFSFFSLEVFFWTNLVQKIKIAY